MTVTGESPPSSSPDPLAISADDVPSRSRTKRRTSTPREPLRGLNGNVRLQDFYLATLPALSTPSPTKSKAQTEDLLSPWRIRVTVEAEREEETEGVVGKKASRSIRLAERSSTTVIPLKSANDPSAKQSKRGRGRPRKSSMSPRKRNGTPKPRGQNQYTIQDMPLNAKATLPHAGTVRRRSDSPSESVLSHRQVSSTRTRKRVPAITPFPEEDESGTPAQRKSRGRRKAITPVGIISDPSSRTIDHAGQGDDISRRISSQNHISSTTVDSPALNNNRLARKLSDKSVGPEHEHVSRRTTNHPEHLLGLPLPTTRPHGARKLINNVDLDAPEGLDERRIDPIDEHRELDSIIESEGFSMISISSLASTRQYLGSSQKLDPGIEEQTFDDESVFLEDESLVVDDESPEEAQDASRHVETHLKQSNRTPVDSSMHSIHSSPPYYIPPTSSCISVKDQTPTAALSSPPLPPPIKTALPRQAPRSLGTTTTGTPIIVRVVHAGIALQGVLDPSKLSPQSLSHEYCESGSSSLIKSPKERLDDLFGGFGAGTRRELRAGLRLGEELAKHQKSLGTISKDDFAAEGQISPRSAQPLYPRLRTPDSKGTHQIDLQVSAKDVAYPCLSNDQLPSPERSVIDADDERMSWVSGTPRQQNITRSPQSETHSGQTFIVDASLMAREQDWQREREAISRQIQMANTSQVIVINSDSVEDADDQDDQDDYDEDIWQEEARSSDRIQIPTPESLNVPNPEVAIKPKRSKLPSPWRRNSQVVNSDGLVTSDAGLFWQPDLRLVQIAKQREDRRRQKQAALDISMASASTASTTDSKINENSSAVSTTIFQRSEPTKIASADTNVDKDQRKDGRPIEAPQPILSELAMSRPNHDSGDHRKENLSETKKQLRNLRTDEIAPTEHILSSHRHATTVFRVHTKVEHVAQENQNAQDQSENTILGDSLSTEDVASQDVPTTTAQSALAVDRPSTSWISRLSNFLTSAPVPAASVLSPSAAISSSQPTHCLNRSSPAELLSPYQPFDIPHYRALLPIYHESRINHAIRPFNPHSASAELLGRTIYSRGFSKDVEKWELGVVDAFMELLTDLRIKAGSQDGKGQVLINEKEVAKRVFGLHIGMVLRGECAFGGNEMPEKWRGRLERGEWAKKGESGE